ncbi:MAG: hypothetical protein OHK0046_21530 [Anaerolineae bacterium]
MPDEEMLHFSFPSMVFFDPTVADGYMKHFVPIPDDVAAALAQAGITHVEGQIDTHPFRRVVHLRPDGSSCLKFGKTWLELAQIEINTPVDVELAPDPDPNRVDVPDELAAELRDAPEVAEVWAGLSPSRQKTLAYNITRAKKAETRQRRAKAVIEELRPLVPKRRD